MKRAAALGQALWNCGHARAPENTRLTDNQERCAICRRALEREASRRYRARKVA